jgi:hypothetical protein
MQIALASPYNRIKISTGSGVSELVRTGLSGWLHELKDHLYRDAVLVGCAKERRAIIA